MITLKTLPQATEQEIFDQVVTHLITQGKTSMNKKGNCVYRSPEGLKCAAGCLIADDEYLPIMDSGCLGTSWTNLVADSIVPPNHADFIRELQIIHDKNQPEHTEAYLIAFANEHNLNYNFPVKIEHAV
jgi:hypothetical protein